MQYTIALMVLGRVSLEDAEIALELISITDGLNVATQDGTDLFEEVGDNYFIGQGDDFSFTPVFYTDADTNSGNYSAEFRLVNPQSNPLPESGRFQINFQVPTQTQVSTPEPSAIISLISLGLVCHICIGKGNKDVNKSRKNNLKQLTRCKRTEFDDF